VYAFNNYFDMAILEWCKVFGSRSEPTHWSAVVEDPDSFRAALLADLALTRDAWDKYWEEMKNYRDLALAHHTLDPRVTSYPKLDVALRATCFHYKFLVEAIRHVPTNPVYFLPKELDSYYQRLLAHAEQVATAHTRHRVELKTELNREPNHALQATCEDVGLERKRCECPLLGAMTDGSGHK